MNKYAEFFTLAKQLPHFGDAERATIVFETSKGRTSSLSELTDSEYAIVISQMRSFLKQATKDIGNRWSEANISNCRKLVIAAIGGYFRITGKDNQSLNTILGTACRHAGTKAGNSFNNIAVDELRRIYNTFMGKQRDCHKAIAKAGLRDSTNDN